MAAEECLVVHSVDLKNKCYVIKYWWLDNQFHLTPNGSMKYYYINLTVLILIEQSPKTEKFRYLNIQNCYINERIYQFFYFIIYVDIVSFSRTIFIFHMALASYFLELSPKHPKLSKNFIGSQTSHENSPKLSSQTQIKNAFLLSISCYISAAGRSSWSSLKLITNREMELYLNIGLTVTAQPLTA